MYHFIDFLTIKWQEEPPDGIIDLSGSKMERGVHILNELTFNDLTAPGTATVDSAGLKDGSGSKMWFILFYAQWCSHSKKLQRPWAEFATAVHNQKALSVRVGKVDAISECVGRWIAPAISPVIV